MEIAKLKERVWLASPTMHKEEQAFIKEAFDTNWVSTVGEHIEKLEEEISQYIGCQYAVALSSGTAALHLAVKMAGIGEGDLVFCSDMTFAATVNPVSYEKGQQIFIDSEYDTWNMDPVALEQACRSYPEAKAVVVAHLYGTPAKLEEIQKICKKYHLILIEDAAESLGATYQGKQTGSFGEYSVVSFNGNKIITTSGGGMFLTDRKEAAEKVRFWSTQAREKVAWYEHKEIGYNYRLSNVLAGVGRGQFQHLEEHKELKKKIYKRYEKGLEGLPVKMNPYLPESEPNFWLSCLLIEEGSKVTPGEIQEKLEEYNIESRPIWKPMHLQPLYRENPFIKREEGKEVGTDIFKRGLCLPSDIKMTEETQEIVIELIKRCFLPEKRKKKNRTKTIFMQWVRYIIFGLQYYLLEKPRGLDFTMRDKSVINQEKGFNGYNKTSESHLRKIFSYLPFEKGLSLIDIGCGKGAVLKEGIKYPFVKVGGIEISEELVTIAQRNFKRLHITDKIECVLADATEYQGYNNYNVFYLANPFGEEMFEKVLKKIELGIEKKEGEEYYLIYYNPLHAEVGEKYNWKLKKKLFDKLRQYDTYIYVRKK